MINTELGTGIANSDPTDINFPIPGNDDARRSIDLYCELLQKTILDAKKYIAKKQLNENEKKNKNGLEKKEKIDQKPKISPKKKDNK